MKQIFSALALGTSLLLSSLAHATDINVPNFSFEDSYYSGDESTTTGVTDWIYANVDGGAYYGTQDNDNQFNNTGSMASPVYGDFVGSQYLYMNMTDGGAASVTSASSLATIQAGMTYTLTVGIGNHLEADDVDYGQPGNQTISLLANGVVISDATRTISNGTLGNGDNAAYSVSFTASGADAIYATQDLTIQLSDNADGVGRPVQAAFDNVELVETPEPGTWAMLLTGLVFAAGIGYRRLRA
jgi:hypothetical protein